VFQITRETTGVSGITALSPALSIAGQADRAAFSVYRGGNYEIHAIDLADDSAATSVPIVTASSPPPAPAANLKTGAFSVPTFDLPNGNAFAVKPYRAGLKLDKMVQPYLSAGGGSTGGFIRGGVGLSFGDMLGDHQLQSIIQVGKNVDDFATEVAYLNLRSRWNWGVLGGQVPWLIGAAQPPPTTSADGSTLTQRADVFRQIHREVSTVAIYPFSGAKRSSSVAARSRSHTTARRRRATSPGERKSGEFHDVDRSGCAVRLSRRAARSARLTRRCGADKPDPPDSGTGWRLRPPSARCRSRRSPPIFASI
jgi:hypothetical protein